MKAMRLSPRRAAFTLVEILVVVAIIGILAAILVPTLAVAMKNVREGAVRMELNQLEMAMEQYAADNGNSYPPDFTIAINPDDLNALDLVAKLNQHLRKISPNHQENVAYLLDSSSAPAEYKNSDDETIFDRNHHTHNASNPKTFTSEGTAPDGTPDITPDEALVYWLAGTSKNLAYPLSGAGDPETGTGERRVYFEFDADQLIDFDGDGFPSYVPKHGPKVPYVYFHHNSYPVAVFQPNLNIVDTGENDKTISGKTTITQARPYARPDGEWVEETGFQIITAGYDGDYGEYPLVFSMDTGDVTLANRKNLAIDTNNGGVPTQRKVFPTGFNFDRRDYDNLASFAERRLDKDID